MTAEHRTDTNGEGGGVRSVRRAFDIVSLLQQGSPTIELREIADATDLPRTTVIRLVDTLEQFGVIWPTGTNKYAIGPALLRWASLAAETWQLPLGAQQAMETLAKVSHETATLFVRQGIRRVCIAEQEGTHALRQVTRVGGEHPMWAGAPAKVLLVGMSDPNLKKIARDSPYGPDHAKRLRRWQADCAEQGYAVSHGEREDGLSVVSVPIRGRLGTTAAALAVAGPTQRFDEARIDDHLTSLRKTVVEMESSAFFDYLGLLEEASLARTQVTKTPVKGERTER